jgi:hypothetical protein
MRIYSYLSKPWEWLNLFYADAQTAEYKKANSRTMSNITNTFLKLFGSLFKSKSISEKQIHPNSNGQEDETFNTNGREEDETDSKVNPTIEKDQPDSETSIDERPEIGQKNKWLYPTDGLGVMEHGVVDSESKETYGKGKLKRN